MSELTASLMSTAIAMSALAIISLVALRGWSKWIEFRRHEIDVASIAQQNYVPQGASTVSRIDIADLRERVRKLEAIAAGVDL